MARFARILLRGVSTDQKSYLLDLETGVLSLFEEKVIINQTVLSLRQAHCLLTLSECYPSPSPFAEMLAWYFDKDVASATRRYNAVCHISHLRERLMKPLFWLTSEMRSLLRPLGLTIVARSEIGYEVHPCFAEISDERARFTVLNLGTLLPPDEQLLLDAQSRVLTLVTGGKTVIEQCILPRKNKELLCQLTQNFPHPTTYEELFAWHYEESLDAARKRYAYVRGNTYQFQLMALQIKKQVKTLRPRLKVFGITIDNLKMFGYTLGSTPRFQFGRVPHQKRPKDIRRKDLSHEVHKKVSKL